MYGKYPSFPAAYPYASPYAYAQPAAAGWPYSAPYGPYAAAAGPAPGTAMSGAPITPGGVVLPTPPVEESYVENILRMNLGKEATIYMTFENNREWNAKVFRGVLEAAGRDHIVISDPNTGMRYLLLTINLDYITFDEPLNYQLPFGMTSVTRP
ncbi:MAG TPA: spore coat protein GerQ [Paenibacillaceae bacterium]